MLVTWNAKGGNSNLATYVNIIHIDLPVLSLEVFISNPHRVDSRHCIPQVLRRKRSRLHIERLLGQLCYLRLIPRVPHRIGGSRAQNGRGSAQQQMGNERGRRVTSYIFFCLRTCRARCWTALCIFQCIRGDGRGQPRWSTLPIHRRLSWAMAESGLEGTQRTFPGPDFIFAILSLYPCSSASSFFTLTSIAAVRASVWQVPRESTATMC